MPSLKLYAEYSRKEAHGILSPKTKFVPQAGTWGLQGVVRIFGRSSDYAFFVTFGQSQGSHKFDEGITGSGVFTWQSQPSQGLADKRVLQWINHKASEDSIYLFLRTDGRRKYAYLGRLAYLSHDSKRERPVYFRWKIIDWALPEGQRKHLGLIYKSEYSDRLSLQMLPVEGPNTDNEKSVKACGSYSVAVGGIRLATLPDYFDLSTRLVNGLKRGFSTGEISVETVAEYAADPNIEQRLLRSWGIGRKSVGELSKLVRSIVGAGSKATDATDFAHRLKVPPGIVPNLLGSRHPVADRPLVTFADAGASVRSSSLEKQRACEVFQNLHFPGCLSTLPTSVRLTNALASFTERHGKAVSLADVLSDYDHWFHLLRRLPNVGQKTLTECRELLCGFVVSRLSHTDEFKGRALEVGKGLCGVEPSQNPTSLPEPVSVDSGKSPEDILTRLLGQLREQPRAIIERRFGLKGQAQTLEEVGRSYDVTRERIRQIEAKTLKDLRRRARKVARASVVEHAPLVWGELSCGRYAVSAAEVERRRKSLSPWLTLALEVAGMTLKQLLGQYAQPLGHGWISPEMPFHVAVELRKRLGETLKRFPLPRSIESLVPESERAAAIAVIEVSGRSTYGSYVIEGRPTVRIRRAVGLHVILSRLGDILQIGDLVTRYRAEMPHDPCSSRDAEIVMEVNRHLFVEVLDGFWATLGSPGSLPIAIPAEPDELNEQGELDEESANEEEPQTISAAIEAELRRSGPLRLSEITDRAKDFLGRGKSTNSIAPMLLQKKDLFVRPLPGVYALRDQVPTPERLLAARPAYLFQEDQVRTYVLARRAGESWGAYPLWTPQAEYLWCEWARKHAEPALLESLLSVITIDDWPEVDDQDQWRELVRNRGRFSIGFPPSFDALVLPALDFVLAAGLFVRNRGQLGWISANRILLRRATENLGAGLLACLVRMGALAADVEDWQLPHNKGPALNDLVATLEEERLRSGALDWDSEFGRTLLEKTLEFPFVSQGWVDGAVLQQLFGANARWNEPASKPSSSLDQLLDERIRSEQPNAFEAVLESLGKKPAEANEDSA